MPLELTCPSHRVPLRADGPSYGCDVDQGTFAVVEGIPILLPDPGDRERILRTDWDANPTAREPLAFYNSSRDHDAYCRERLDDIRADVERCRQSAPPGPTLEIGTGKGALQGMGDDYVALDYSLSALRRYVADRHQRVCGTASALPFPDSAFAFVFSVATLEHVPDASSAFAEIARVLAPGGVAYLAPAWHCVQYNCDGIPVRAYSDLSLRQKLVKLSLPLRRTIVAKTLATLPRRVARRVLWATASRGPTEFRFEPLRPDYTTFWMSDSDAAARLDSHEACLFFHSRGYEVIRPGRRALAQLFARHGPVVVRKSG